MARSIAANSRFVDAKAATMNGVDECVYANNPAFSSHQEGAISFWLKTSSIFSSNGSKVILSFGVRDAANNSRWFMSIRRNSGYGTNDTRLEVITATPHGTNSRLHWGATALAANVWYHVVVQCNATTISIYLNGVQETLTYRTSTPAGASGTNSGSWFGDITGTLHRFALGALFYIDTTSSYADVVFNEVAYFARALTGAEITELYNAGTPRNPHRLSFAAQLQHWWRMGESRDSATTIHDEVGSTDLTLMNMDATNYVAP